MDSFTRISFLKKIHLFFGLGDDTLTTIADQLQESAYPSGQAIFKQGEKAESFYLIYAGSVKIVSWKNRKEKPLATLTRNDYFGEMALLERRNRSATATAAADTLLLTLSRDTFLKLLKENPQFRLNLDLAVRSRKLTRSLQFKWLASDEVIYFLARKHPIVLFKSLIAPMLALVAPFFFLFWWSSVETTLLVLIAGLGSLLFIILWIVWLVLDWQNDYYIVTNRRVVWLEKIIAFYDSRQESPLTTILAVATETDLLGRWLDFGDVIVRTYVGKITFRSVSHPNQAQRMIQEYWDRTKDIALDVERQSIRKALSSALERRMGVQVPPQEKPAPKKAGHPREKGLAKLARFFGADRLRLRYEQGDTVVYRKHWFVLIRKAWLPILGLLTIAGLFLYRLYILITSPEALVSMENGVAVDTWSGALFILFFIMFVWFIYDFVDWSNDRFEVTSEQIVDVYKKPLSTQIRNASQLENILGTEYARVGILGELFNYGTVFITVGSTKLTFEDVIDPATVQADIDRRRMAQKTRKEEKEKSAKREELAEWLITYHHYADKLRQEENERRQKPE